MNDAASQPRRWHADTEPARELFAAAAVRDRFVPSELLARWTERHGIESFGKGKGAMAAVEAALDLENLAEPGLAADGSEAFVLPKQVRLDILGAADDRLLRQSLPDADSATLTERALRDIFDGTRSPDAGSSRTELSAYITAVEWAQAAGLASEVDIPVLNRQQSLQDFIETLAGDELHRFVGRERLLASLHRIWNLPSDVRPAVQLEGPGGIGKSLLAARFITELLAGPAPPNGVFVIDFERHEFRGARVSAIFREMIRQTARWWIPEAAALLEQSSDRLDYGTLESVGSVDRSSEAMQDDTAVAAQLVGYFRDFIGASQPSFVVFADTFEEVAGFDDEAMRSVARACALLRQCGATVLELYASRSYPSYQIWPGQSSRFVLGRLTQLEAQDYLRNEACSLGIELSRKDANAAQHKIGGWPLNLRLAAGLLPGATDPASWIASLEASGKRIQATLYERLLDRIRDEDVRKLAKPGLLLRRLTGPIVEQVLARPCGLDVAARGGEAIVARARELGQLFVTDRSDPGAVWHRADVRSLMYKDLRNAIEPRIRQDIHRRAAKFYGEKGTAVIDRAEHLYHLLQLEEPVATLETVWAPELGPRLKSALDEFPDASAAWLRTRLGAARVSAPPRAGSTTAAASPHRLQELRLVARKRFQEGNPVIADLLAEAGLPHSALSEFGDLYIQSLVLQGDLRKALAEAVSLKNSRKRISASVRSGAYAAAAAILEGQDRLGAAHAFWKAAKVCARDMEPIDRLNPQIGELRAARRMGRSLAARRHGISRAIAGILSCYRELRERRVAAREALAEVAEWVFPNHRSSDIGIALTDLCIDLLHRDELFVWAKQDPDRRKAIFSLLEIGSFSNLPIEQTELNNVCSKMIFGDRSFWPKLTRVIQAEVDWSLTSSARRPRMAAKPPA